MGALGKIFTCGTAAALVFSVAIGLFLSGVPRQLGFFTIMPGLLEGHGLYGLVPAFIDGVPWGYTFDDLSKVRLDGQNALVTGANAGIGFSLSRHLAKQGATVYMACRNVPKCAAASAKIEGHTVPLTMDTSSLASVRAFAEDFLPRVDTLDMLYLNAGTGAPYLNEDGSLGTSVDGIEHVFATNYVGHHLLYQLVAAKVAASPVARIVLTSSASHYDSYPYGVATSLEQLNGASGGMKPYGQSKLAQVLWAQELTRQLGDDATIFVNSFHPGAAASEIWSKNHLLPIFIRDFIESVKDDVMWSCDEGALTGLYLGVHVGLVDTNVRGKYFHPQSHAMVPAKATFDEELQKRVWEFSDQLTK